MFDEIPRSTLTSRFERDEASCLEAYPGQKDGITALLRAIRDRQKSQKFILVVGSKRKWAEVIE